MPARRVPATVQAVLAARIDRLPPEAKWLLQTAAVIGPEVPVALVQAIAALPEEAMQHGLAQLQAAEFLAETRLFPEQVYTFKHALTHEVAYGSLAQERRCVLHARIMGAMETLFAGRLGEQVERLAQHALRGEVWDKAVVYYCQAGKKAMERSAHREAVAAFEQALLALHHLPECRDTREQAIDRHLDLSHAHRYLGDFGRAFEHLREAEALAVALDDPSRLGRVSSVLTYFSILAGDYDRAIATGQRALALATDGGDLGAQISGNFQLGLAYYRQGDFRRAMDVLRQAVGALAGTPHSERLGQAVFHAIASGEFLARCLAEVGRFAEGLAIGTEGLRMAEAATHPLSLMSACFGIGFTYLRQGTFDQALPRLERAVHICQEVDSQLHFPEMAAGLGAAYTLAGRTTEAFPLLEQVVERGTTLPRMDGHALRVAYLSEAYLQAGGLEEARALAQRALALSLTYKERGHQAYALQLLGDIYAHPEIPDAAVAEAFYRQALALAQELGMRPLQAHCYRGLGTLSVQRGLLELARTALATALDLYRAMDMPFWLPQTEAMLAQVEGHNAHGGGPSA